MLGLVQRVNWQEYLLILSQGNPPIGLQLLVINAALVGWWLYRRTRRKSRQASTWLLQLLFVGGNLGIFTWGSRLSF